MSRDIPYEARVLVKRMRNDAKVDLADHWKLVTILIGPNDFCLDFCYLSAPQLSPESHRRELIETLRVLRDNLPRTIINLVTPPSKCAHPNVRVNSDFVMLSFKEHFCTHIDIDPC